MIERIRNVLKKLIKGYLRDFFWIIYGKTINNPHLSYKPKSIVFVCKGNICRSPFSHHLAHRIIENKLDTKIDIDSAGLEAKAHERSPENAIAAATGFGLNLENHIPKSIEQNIFEGSAMVIAMETGHFQTLRKRFPDARYKIFLLPLFENDEKAKMRGFCRYNIEDPYGRDLDEFKKCFRRIERCITALFEEIEKAAD
jgi:protein-tyrosine phosphatase